MLKGFSKHTFSSADGAQARNEVDAFHAEYCAALDENDIERWPEFFTEDCFYRVTERENADLNLPVGLIYAEGRAMLQDRAVAIGRTQMFAPRNLLHMISNIRILSVSAEAISAIANYLLLQTLVEGPTTIHQAGRIYDRFVRVDGRLLIKERQAVYDTAIIANDLVYPI
jgi:anthranilate 1,2-dioxygenase small subunit